MTLPRIPLIHNLSFSQDKRLDREIRETVASASTSISASGPQIREKLFDHPHAGELEDNQNTLEDEVDVFYERLDEANAKEKKDERISNLRHIKTDAKRFSEDVNEHVGKVRTSIRQQESSRRKRAKSTTQPTPSAQGGEKDLNRTSTSSSSPDVNRPPYLHPVYYWSEAMIDAINAAESLTTCPNSDESTKSNHC